MLGLLLLAAPSVGAEQPGLPNGRNWRHYTADEKLMYLQGSFELAAEQGLRMKYHALFYLVAVNDFYSHDERLDVNLAKAVAAVARPLGDMTMAEQ